MPDEDIEDYEMQKIRAIKLLGDLDRCEHGRHAIDSCPFCPGGQSSGNKLLTSGTVLGHGVHGERIVVPAEVVRSDPRAWMQKR